MIRYQPFRFPLGDMTRDIDRVFDRLLDNSFSFPRGETGFGAGAAANLYETPEGYWVELPLPGVKAEDVEVTVQDNVLSLRAKREWKAPENAKVIWQGFTGGVWEQSFTLPGEVNRDTVSASLEHGILRLELPKAEHTKPRTIRVNAAGTGNADTNA
jgi:HSP20 family protein